MSALDRPEVKIGQSVIENLRGSDFVARGLSPRSVVSGRVILESPPPVNASGLPCRTTHHVLLRQFAGETRVPASRDLRHLAGVVLPAVADCFDLIFRDGATKEEALAVTAVVFKQEAALVFGLDSFGERFEAERVSELDH
jgi:hypothetical protein